MKEQPEQENTKNSINSSNIVAPNDKNDKNDNNNFLSSSIETMINNVNKFYEKIDEVKNKEEEFNSKFKNILGCCPLNCCECCLKHKYKDDDKTDKDKKEIKEKKERIKKKKKKI